MIKKIYAQITSKRETMEHTELCFRSFEDETFSRIVQEPLFDLNVPNKEATDYQVGGMYVFTLEAIKK